MNRFLAAVGSVILLAQESILQAAPRELRIIVEDVVSSEIACGITTDGIRAALLSAMRYNRIERTNDTSAPYAYAHATSINSRTGCITSYAVSIRKVEAVSKPQATGAMVAIVVYCEAGGILSGASHSARVYQNMKSYFDNCLADYERNAI